MRFFQEKADYIINDKRKGKIIKHLCCSMKIPEHLGVIQCTCV